MTAARPLDLDALTLARGSHKPEDGAMCLMEAVAYVAGEEWSDHPSCASPVIGTFMRQWNDALPDADRNRLLKPYVLRLVGTASTADIEDARAMMCLDWLVRTYTPAWLRLAGLADQADSLAGLAELTPRRNMAPVLPTISAVRDAAGVAARVAAWVAARDAVRVAAWVAARDVLAPTAAELQQSALTLIHRMIGR